MNEIENKLAIDDLLDTGLDFSEIAIDAFLNEGIVKEMPVFKTVVALFKTGKSIKDYYSIKKLIAFLNGCKGMSQHQIDSFVKTLDNEKKRADVGMRILLIVDKVDAIEKAALIGKALKLVISGEIKLSFYLRLCHMIEKCFYSDILALQQFENEDSIFTSTNKTIPTEVLDGLFTSGLLGDYGFDGGDFSGGDNGTRYGLNDYSIALKKTI